MRFATLIVEQLDRAATELAVNHPLNARMALILIDNAAELIIHRRCESLVRSDRKNGAPKLTAANRRSILGHYFGEKIKFLEKMTAISDGERHFINELHAHRNTLYHVGLSYDDIIRPLAVAYFQLTCDLLHRLDNRTLGWPSELVIASSLHQYFPHAATGRRFPGYDSGRVSKLLLDRTADFQKLVRERMRKNGKEDQFIPFGHPVMNELAAKLMPKWKARYTSPPFAKWRVRAKAIAKVSDPLSAIRKFTDLRGEMEYLAQAVDEAHEEFWGWAQQQEDAAQDARGR